MTINTLAPTGNSMTQAAQRLAAQIDGNRDGQISATEFQSFMTNLVDALSKGAPVGHAKAAGTDTPGARVDPSRWTDNNAPYGVTFAGFSPQNHTNLTLADLNSTTNAKYAVFEYLLSNRVAPNGSWAQAAADALNQQTGTTVFHAIDGETLGYGDEYVHSAPNGYGMAQGTYDPRATGEFFWGVQA